MRIIADDRQLADINSAHTWLFEQTDEVGRIIGKNREGLEPARWKISGLPWRIDFLQHKIRFADRKVAEFGSLEGVLTSGLCHCGADVTSFDIRPSCLTKAMLRCAVFGYSPRFVLTDLRTVPDLSNFELLYHCGVLYHLHDPITHFFNVSKYRLPIILDTHTAILDAVTWPRVELQGYYGHWMGDGAWNNDLSGVEQQSFWLEKESLLKLCADAGYEVTEWWEDLQHQGGPRSMYYLEPMVAGL